MVLFPGFSPCRWSFKLLFLMLIHLAIESGSDIKLVKIRLLKFSKIVSRSRKNMKIFSKLQLHCNESRPGKIFTEIDTRQENRTSRRVELWNYFYWIFICFLSFLSFFHFFFSIIELMNYHYFFFPGDKVVQKERKALEDLLQEKKKFL